MAGMFYPNDAAVLERIVADLLDDVSVASTTDAGDEPCPKALIVPHAGYVYSGPVAAHAYVLLQPHRERIRRVVLLGPAHRVYLEGMALPSAEVFSTPMGRVPIDVEAIEQIRSLPDVVISEEAHALEHSLEVQVPFLQAVLDQFVLVPVVVGHCPSERVARVIEELWGGDETLIVVSSDLSHYLGYEAAKLYDAATTRAICAGSATIDGEQACGAYAINGLLRAIGKRDMEIRLLDLRNSGDTAGDRSRVVGYGAYAVR